MEEEILEDFKKYYEVETISEAIEKSEYIKYKGKKWIREDLVIPTSVIQNTLDDTNKNIEEFTKNVVTTKEEIEQEYWKSELNKAIAKRNILQEILEEGRR